MVALLVAIAESNVTRQDQSVTAAEREIDHANFHHQPSHRNENIGLLQVKAPLALLFHQLRATKVCRTLQEYWGARVTTTIKSQTIRTKHPHCSYPKRMTTRLPAGQIHIDPIPSRPQPERRTLRPPRRSGSLSLHPHLLHLHLRFEVLHYTHLRPLVFRNATLRHLDGLIFQQIYRSICSISKTQ